MLLINIATFMEEELRQTRMRYIYPMGPMGPGSVSSHSADMGLASSWFRTAARSNGVDIGNRDELSGHL